MGLQIYLLDRVIKHIWIYFLLIYICEVASVRDETMESTFAALLSLYGPSWQKLDF